MDLSHIYLAVTRGGRLCPPPNHITNGPLDFQTFLRPCITLQSPFGRPQSLFGKKKTCFAPHALSDPSLLLSATATRWLPSA